MRVELEAAGALSNPIADDDKTFDTMTPAERSKLLQYGEPFSSPAQGVVHQLFERQVEKNAKAVAVQYEDDTPVTYQELNAKANAVARQLVCGRGVYVTVCLSRSVEMVISILAVLKTGAAYVLLSEDSPVERNTMIVNQVQAPFTITNRASRSLFSQAIVIEDLLLASGDYDAANLNIYQDPSDIAYVIFTSGTTGIPKGVMLEHNAAYSGLSALPEQPNLRQLLCHSPVFSAAQRSILGTLKRGGTLCIATKNNLTVNLQATIKRMRISSLEIVPSMAELIDPSSAPSHLQRITFGGESISQSIVQRWADHVELVNAYGLSENTQMNWRQVLKSGANHRLIGRPTDTTTSYVLVPESTQMSPINVPGELCLGGYQLARGYLRDPQKTREVFIDNPFGPGRLYRTGDFVVCHSDGNIEMLGRLDQQVKIGGQRVEPEESNNLIRNNPDVIESCTVAAQVFNRTALVAVVVPSQDINWSTLVAQLRKNVGSHLSTYAAPSYWMKREELPRNINGKIDLPGLKRVIESLGERDLLSLSRIRRESMHTNANEDLILQAVAARLSIAPSNIDLYASFLDLGGSSLDAINIATSLKEKGIAVDVASILQAENLKAIAAQCKPTEAHKLKEPEPFSLGPPAFRWSNAFDAYPTTPLQEGLLADTLMGNTQYVYRRAYRINNVSLSQLKAAFTSVIGRSAILRTSFVPYKASFMQAVSKSIKLPWQEVKADIGSFMKSSVHIFNDITAPLLRLVVLNGKVLVVDIHHALFDFWSNRFLFDDVNATLLGRTPLSRAPFSSYVRFQREQNNDSTRTFWERYLRGAKNTLLTLHGLPQHAREDSQKAFVVETKVEADFTSIKLRHGITIGSLMHAVWALGLCAWSNQEDVQFVAAFSGRDANVHGILDLDGPTLCTVPMRVRVDLNLSLLDFVREIQKDHLWTLPGYAHYGIRNALKAGGVDAHAFNTMVNVLLKASEASQIEQPLEPIAQDHPNFTEYMTLEVDENSPGVVRLLVPFAANIGAAQALIESFARMLEFAVETPTISVRQLLRDVRGRVVLGQPELQMDDKSMPATNPTLAHSQLEEIAVANPDKTALIDAQGKISYSELNGRANSFASWLQNKGVQPGDIVPLYMEKSSWTVVAIFGTLKAGAAFTPLDPANPYDRNSFIINDVEAKVVVTDWANLEQCRVFGIEPIVIEGLDLLPTKNHSPHVPEMSPDSIVYIIYTSGSTGTPKGVLVQHSAVVASTEGMIEATNVDSSWRSLWALNYVFDASYYDIFTILSAGGTLCILPQDDLISDLTASINRFKVTQVMLTPTITKLISGGPKCVPHLKVLSVCGEKIDTNILEWAKSTDVYNGYGPTEATVLMTVSKVLPGSSLNSVGYPMKHVTASVRKIDSVAQMPVGEVGELCVSGPQLAKAYLKRPEQTAASFIQDEGGEKLYRTGDLARWHENGHIECLGRKDNQAKMNGHRIEPGEIENAILNTNEVDGCVVTVTHMQGKPQLTAFCIFAGDHKASKETVLLPWEEVAKRPDIRDRLTSLPEYMRPNIFLPFSSFSTLPSGKTDRKKLANVAESMSSSMLLTYLQREASYEAFRPVETEQERVMLESWSMVFDEADNEIGATTNFASLGGDSIAAINVVATCRALGWSVTVNNILSNKTLAKQARHLKRAIQQEAVQDIKYDVPASVKIALEKAGVDIGSDVEDIYPAGPGQTEFLQQGHNTDKQYWQLTVYRSVAADFDINMWLNATKALTARNQILRATYITADSTDPLSWMQVILKSPVLDWLEVGYSSEKEKIHLIEALRDSHFVFGKPAVRYALLTSSVDNSRTLAIKLHHASYDGTLLRIFDDQFTALTRGDQNIPAVTEFKPFIDRNYSSDKEVALAYWTGLLQDYQPVAKLPEQRTQNGHLKFATVSAAIDMLAVQSGATASSIFQAAYTVLIGRLSGSADVLYDNLLTGRNAQVDNPQLVNGTCANFLPFRSRFQDTDTVSNLIHETQSLFWETTEHGTVSLNDIYKALQQDRDTYSARMLFCFQPFEPAAGDHGQMHWIVFSISKIMMNIPYIIMLEVQKALTGYRIKMQYDADTISVEQADEILRLYNQILEIMVVKPQGRIEELSQSKTMLDGLWKD